jgi:hypothetical protein
MQHFAKKIAAAIQKLQEHRFACRVCRHAFLSIRSRDDEIFQFTPGPSTVSADIIF